MRPRLLLLLLTIPTLAGCLPVAWVTPPSRLDAGAGLQSMRVDPLPGGEPARAARGHYDLRASITPLQLSQQEDRLLDIGFGYGMRGVFIEGGLIHHGPFTELGVLSPLESSGARLGASVQLHALGDNAAPFALSGARGAARLTIEWAGHAEAPFADCNFTTDGGFCGGGFAFGEGGFGLWAELSHARLRRGVETAFTMGVSFRLPATIGAGFLLLDWTDLL